MGRTAPPIVLRPDDGHTPLMGGRIELAGCSYWTIRGLTFDGQNTQLSNSAITVVGYNPDVAGLIIEDNTILDWDAPLPGEGDFYYAGAISLESSPEDPVIAPIIRNNRILGRRGKAIFLNHVENALVEGNEIGDIRCQVYDNGNQTIGIHIEETSGTEIARNYIHDLDNTECPLSGDERVTAIYIHQGDDWQAHHNLIVRVGGGNAMLGMGLNTIQNADNASVHHNIVVEADECGLCNGARASGGSASVRYVHNTVIGGNRFGLDQDDGANSVWLNNLVTGASLAQVRLVSADSAGWTFDHNLYFSEEPDAIGDFSGTPSELEPWQTACGCDENSLSADPLLPPSGLHNFTPAANSPAVDAGVETPEGNDFNGAAPDIGALEAPVVTAVTITAAEPDRVRIDIQSVDRSAAVRSGVAKGCSWRPAGSRSRPRAASSTATIACSSASRGPPTWTRRSR